MFKKLNDICCPIYKLYKTQKVQPSGGTSSSDLEEDPEVLSVDVLVGVVLVLILYKSPGHVLQVTLLLRCIRQQSLFNISQSTRNQHICCP